MAKIYQLDVDGIIGFDVIPEDIKSKLKLADGEPIEVRFSSPGGFIYPGLQIFNLFRNYTGKKTARIVGLAASMASYIPMAFDEIIVEDNSVFMIHNARQGVAGDHNDMRKAADLLERMSNMLSDAYVKKTKKDKKEIQKMMDKETFLFGQEIVDYGFADRIIKSEKTLDRVSIESQAQSDYQNCMTMLKEADKKDFEQAAALLEIPASKNVPDYVNNFENILTEINFLIENTTEFNPENPYPGEHACRLVDPIKFTSFRRQNNAGKVDGKSIDFIYGIKDNKSELQAIRYPKDIWKPEDARKHCESRKGTSFERASGCHDCTHKDEQGPANKAGENKSEDLRMNLEQFLNENPGARAEFDAKIKAAVSVVENRIAAVTPYLGNKDYAKAMPMAMQALKGDVDMSAFKGAIAAFDMLKEQTADANAEIDTEAAGKTPAAQIKQPSAGVKVEKPEDISNAVKEAKSMLGMVV
jgi:ATP-dependent protease ClpP protease subunit